MRASIALAEQRQRPVRGPHADRLEVERAVDSVENGGPTRAMRLLGAYCHYTERGAQPGEPRPDPRMGEFGRTFTDHMLECAFRQGEWQAPRIVPRHALALDPGASSLQYGLQIFEGMKVYRPKRPHWSAPTPDMVRLFRPLENMRRLCRSAARLALPLFDAHAMLQLVEEYVRVEAAWVPQCDADEEALTPALYLRPTLISTDARLGVRRPSEALFYVIASPALGSYYSGNNHAAATGVTLFATDAFARAWPGGVGDAKCGGNYALGLVAQELAIAEGCQQVLWLDAQQRVTEAGVMNFFVVFDDGEVCTPPVDTGMILPGVTRDSVLQLIRGGAVGAAPGGRAWRVHERALPIDELTRGIVSGRVVEAFGTGTAATISPVAGIRYRQREYRFEAPARPLSTALKRAFDHICYGDESALEAHPWLHPVYGSGRPAAASASHTQFG